MAKLDLTNLEKMREISIADWGETLIVAPHPDDESLGCGGAIRLLRENKNEVFVLVLSDGTLSHPNSIKFPAAKLRDLREKEIIAALKILGVAEKNICFFRYPDRNVPDENSETFDEAVEQSRKYLSKINPKTVVVPWRRDPHPDHRAAFSIIKTAQSFYNFRIVEYPIWLWEIAENADAPQISEVAAVRLNIVSVKDEKRRAIYRHQSQIGEIIDDDPEGFRLSPEILEKFLTDWEIFFEAV